MKKLIYFSLTISILLLTGCSVVEQGKHYLKGGEGETGFNVFPLSKDVELGHQVAQEIKNNPKEYPILDSASHPKIYAYIYSIRDRILNSGAIIHKDDFPWQMRIISNDTIKNAFCTPGGYIYIYSGLMKYLKGEDALAGVMGHEMGHADLRHSTRQMTKMYGVTTILNYLAGDHTQIKNIAGQLIGIQFTRSMEKEADAASVKFLCPTKYDADAAAKFFEQLKKDGGTSAAPEWLRSHPSPENRIEHFHSLAKEMGCRGTTTNAKKYQSMLKYLDDKKIDGLTIPIGSKKR